LANADLVDTDAFPGAVFSDAWVVVDGIEEVFFLLEFIAALVSSCLGRGSGSGVDRRDVAAAVRASKSVGILALARKSEESSEENSLER